MNKPLWKSKTIWSAAALLGIGIAQYFGINIDWALVGPILGSFGLYGVRDALK